MPASISHVKNVTIPDDADTGIVRPSDWNSNHNFTFNAVGSEISGAFANDGGVTFGYNGTNITASVIAGAAGIGLNTAVTGASMTANTSGISINVPAAAPSPVYVIAGSTNGSLGTISYANGSGVTWGLNGSTVTASVQTNYLTTAMASNRTLSLNEIASPHAGSDVFFSFSQGQQIQFQFSNTGTFTTNANKQGLFEIDIQGNLLDGADAVHIHQSDNDPKIDLVHIEGWGTNVTGLRIRASASVAAEINKPIKFTTDTGVFAIGTVPFIMGTQMSNVVGNLNANYLQGRQSSEFLTTAQSPGAYLTTAMASNRASDWVAASGGITGTNITGTLFSNGISLSVAAPGGGGGAGSGTALALTNLTGTLNANSNGISLSLSGNAAGGGGANPQHWMQGPMIRFSLSNLTNITALDKIPFFVPIRIDGTLTVSRLNWEMSRSTSGSNNFSVTAGFFSYANATQLSLLTSFSGNFSNTATASISAIRRFGIGASATFSLPPGGYVFGMMFSAGATASMNYSIRGFSGAVQAGAVVEGTDQYNTATNYNIFPFYGRNSVSLAAFPTSVDGADVRGQFGGASAPINAWLGFNDD